MLTHKHSRDHLVSLVGEIRRKEYPSYKKFIQCLFNCHSKNKNFCLKYEHEELETKKESPNHESKLKLL